MVVCNWLAKKWGSVQHLKVLMVYIISLLILQVVDIEWTQGSSSESDINKKIVTV